MFFLLNTGKETSPMTISASGLDGDNAILPNEISAPYEVPQFPIEQIEKKLQIQRHINERYYTYYRDYPPIIKYKTFLFYRVLTHLINNFLFVSHYINQVN